MSNYQYVEIDKEILSQYPDVFCYEVIGRCMEPRIPEGQLIALSASEPITQDRIIAFDTNRRIPRLGIVDEVMGEFVKWHDNLGGCGVALDSEVLGVVVAIV